VKSMWSFHLPTEVLFGNGVYGDMPLPAEEKVLVVSTSGSMERGTLTPVMERMADRSVELFTDVRPNPDLDGIDAAAADMRRLGIEAVLAVGGGSSIDTAKALARLLPNPDLSLSANLREGKAAKSPPLPLTAVPTTSGTGSEVTPFATIWDRRDQVKRSVDGKDVFPLRAVVDPMLTLTLPRDQTIATGMDAISHAFESIWNSDCTPVSTYFAFSSLSLSLDSLARAAADGSDLEAREMMSEASLLAGMSISQTRTAVAHSMSYPITMEMGLDHGVACSLMLPELLRYNAVADDGRLQALSMGLGYRGPEELAEGLEDLQTDLGLDEMYRSCEEVDLLCLDKRMLADSRAVNNMRPVGEEELRRILSDMDARLRRGP